MDGDVLAVTCCLADVTFKSGCAQDMYRNREQQLRTLRMLQRGLPSNTCNTTSLQTVCSVKGISQGFYD